jgi:uncharacterized membrane protein
MRVQNVLIGFMTIVLAAVTMLGSVYSGSFPQASQAESAGFDALAHNLFADVLGPSDEEQSK